MASTSTYKAWLDLADDELTPINVHGYLDALHDDLWVTAACYDRLVDDVEVQQALLDIGLQRTSRAFQRYKDALSIPNGEEGSRSDDQGRSAALIYFQDLPVDAQLCRLHGILLGRLHRLHTYTEMCKELPESYDAVAEDLDEWEDDPWAETSTTTTTKEIKTDKALPIPLSAFLTQDLAQSARLMALEELFGAVRVLLDRHGDELWPHRFSIYESFPAHVDPSAYHEFLPRIGSDDNELIAPWRHAARPDFDPILSIAIDAASDALQISSGYPYTPPPLQDEPLGGDELSAWYIERVNYIMSNTGILDSALALVQHGASQGVAGLDELGEDLNLLTRLVYDAPSSADLEEEEEWTLARWKSMDPKAVVKAYTAHSTPESLPNDILHLVMPYLYVLESRAERQGNPNPLLHLELLYDYILNAPLEFVASIFEASKPTLPAAQRIIKNDEDMARLSLACLYGSDSLDEWPTMSRIFECLPAWDLSAVEDYDEDVADTTIASLGDFVTPSIARPRCTPSDLMIFFKPLPMSSLSRALDILDVHLESGEILSRWSVPAPFSWFLQSRNNEAEQRAWANRMARRAGAASGDAMETLEDWNWLLDDMLKLAGSGENELKGAFGLLSENEVVRIFFSGLLSVGRFDLAKVMLRENRHVQSLTPETVEEICLTCSREFYDNAASGNYKVGDMKQAYDCLSVLPTSERVAKEREFIEATSRLSSFNVMSRPGIPISPIEIRLTKDRLSLISRLLSSNDDAYKHAEVILDLVHMLGFRGDVVAEVKVLAMLADAALQAEDFPRAYATSERMVAAVQSLRSGSHGELDEMREASDVCWVACFQLARHPEFDATEEKMTLFGRALELCPPDKLHDVLTAWTRLEAEDIERREAKIMERKELGLGSRVIPQKRSATVAAANGLTVNVPSSLRSQLAGFHLPSTPLLNTPDAAALASKTFKSVAANFPFTGLGGRSESGSDGGRSESRTSRRDDGDMATQANRVFSKGIGWLIGVDGE